MAKKKRITEDEPGVDVGMVMTVSLFLILLTFFILLNSIAVIDENRTRVAIGSLIGAFGGLPGGLSPLDTGDSILPPSAPMVSEELTVEQLLSYMNRTSPLLSEEIKIETVKHGEVISINENAIIEKNGLKINPDLIPFLKKLCNIINTGDYPVEIVSHTNDSSAQEKGYRSNFEVSALIAIQVLKCFVSEGKVDPQRLTAYGHGSHRPIASNDTRYSRAKNRRVDIILRYAAPAYVKRIYRKKTSGYVTYKKFDFKIF
ncbi:MAG: OmpA family protein [Proteobacteria bacterium]|nr:OmpA family protein [Pseudomonadota bacterium]